MSENEEAAEELNYEFSQSSSSEYEPASDDEHEAEEEDDPPWPTLMRHNHLNFANQVIRPKPKRKWLKKYRLKRSMCVIRSEDLIFALRPRALADPIRFGVLDSSFIRCAEKSKPFLERKKRSWRRIPNILQVTFRNDETTESSPTVEDLEQIRFSHYMAVHLAIRTVEKAGDPSDKDLRITVRPGDQQVIEEYLKDLCLGHFLFPPCSGELCSTSCHFIVDAKFRDEKLKILDDGALVTAYSFSVKFPLYKSTFRAFLEEFADRKIRNFLAKTVARDVFRQRVIPRKEALGLVVKALQRTDLSFFESVDLVLSGFLEREKASEQVQPTQAGQTVKQEADEAGVPFENSEEAEAFEDASEILLHLIVYDYDMEVNWPLVLRILRHRAALSLHIASSLLALLFSRPTLSSEVCKGVTDYLIPKTKKIWKSPFYYTIDQYDPTLAFNDDRRLIVEALRRQTKAALGNRPPKRLVVVKVES